MKKNKTFSFRPKAMAVAVGLAMALPGLALTQDAEAVVAATHIYHNHMPNFWPYYDTSTYKSAAVGSPIRYTYDGGALEIKTNPPAGYKYLLPTGAPMPHDNLEQYYMRDAKQNAYTVWPAQTARANSGSHPKSQTHVTMSAAVINNVQDFAERGSFNAFYKPGWSADWKSTVGSLKTANGFNALDPIHFTGHHSMGPLVGPEYFLKDLIYQNVTLQQDYFLGSQFKSSKGFFPTELGFSERLIPTLKKLGIEWSVMGNNHFSRALRDYPYNNENPAYDTLVSPPNRADLQNVYEKGKWEHVGMAHEQQNILNKFPFCDIPHWVQYVNPETGEVSKLAGIPVDQNGSWLEGWEGIATASNEIDRPSYEADAGGRTIYFVIAHDGDNGEGRAGSIGTWLASGQEYSSAGVVGMGVDEYLKAYPIPADDIQHVQDGSWVDTRDSSSDPDWYHWHIPMGVWKGQLADFNTANGTEFELPANFAGTPFGHAVSLEYGYHYLERNFAILQASLNYAKTAEQIWLDTHPNYWSPSTDAEKQVTYAGNQLNPYMMSYPVKGDEANDYKGGANPAELAWYFLISSIDSGFGYYDENVDDNVKPSLGFNQSLFFSEPYVSKNLAKDKTGPSMWWVQRYPTNPGSANSGKAEGWTTAFADNTWAVYTYAYDVSGIKDVKVYVRAHKDKRMSPTDIAPRVYNPKAFTGQPNVDVNQVGEWKVYSTKKRELEPVKNGVAWQANAVSKNYEVLPAQKIGDTYYAYISDFRDQLVDYYMEATDNLGNVTRSEIGHTYVGAGRYTQKGSGYEEDVNGEIEGTHMFFTDGAVVLTDKVTVYAKPSASDTGSVYLDYKDSGTGAWSSLSMDDVKSSGYFKTTVTYTRDAGCADIRIHNNGENTFYPSADGKCLSKGVYTIAQNGSVTEGAPTDIPNNATIYFKPSVEGLAKVCIHYRGTPGAETDWTTPPGAEMDDAGKGWYKKDLSFDSDRTGIEFLFNDCGNSWYKTSSGGNFTISSVQDSSVDGTKLTDGIPEALDTRNKAPKAVISGGSEEVAPGTSVVLDASGSTDPDGTISSYKWSTGETTAKITVTPEKTTSYTVTVTDNQGAVSAATVTVNVKSDEEECFPNGALPAPIVAEVNGLTAKFWTAPGFDNGCGVSYDYENISWDFGDGETATGNEVSHTYKAAGEYTVTMKKSSSAGDAMTETQKIMASSPDDVIPVKAVITASATEIDQGETVTLNASGSTGAGLTYSWNTGATTASIRVTPEATTSYKLTVTDRDGRTDQEVITVTVRGVDNHAPVAVIESSATTIKTGGSAVLDASASSDADGDAITYKWSTGETTDRITVTPEETTRYSVTVTDAKGATGTASAEITVVPPSENLPPVISVSPKLTAAALDAAVEFVAVASDDGEISNYSWLVDGAEISSGKVTSFTHKFSSYGTHKVVVTVTDNEGLTSSAEAVVQVNDSGEVAGFVEIEGPAEVNALSRAQYSAANAKLGGNRSIGRFVWEVDGEKLTVSNPVLNWSFSKAGTHIVTVTVFDSEDQAAATDTHSVYVRGYWKEGEVPDFSFGSGNGGSSASKIGVVTADNTEVTPLDVYVGKLFTLIVEKLDMTYKVYKKTGAASQSAAVQSMDGYTLCRVTNGSTVDCNAASGDDYVTVKKGDEFKLDFAEAGDYRLVTEGIDATAQDTNVFSGYIPLTVKNADSGVTPGEEPGDDPVTPDPDWESDSDSDSSAGSGGKKGGGAMDMFSLAMLSLGSLFLRRRKNKK